MSDVSAQDLLEFMSNSIANKPLSPDSKFSNNYLQDPRGSPNLKWCKLGMEEYLGYDRERMPEEAIYSWPAKAMNGFLTSSEHGSLT